MINKRIKICYVFNSLNIGGTEILTLNVIKNLSRKYFDITIINLFQPNDEFLNLRKKIPFDVKFIQLDINKISFLERISLLKNLLEPFDVVHSSMENSNLYCSIVSLLFLFKKKIFINTIHGVEGVFIDDEKLKEELKKWDLKYIFLYTTFLNFTFKKYDKFFSVCEDTKRSFMENRNIKGNKIEVIYHGLNIEDLEKDSFKTDSSELRKSFGFEDSDFIIGYVGRLTFAKGLEYFIDVFSKDLSKFKNMKLLLVGDGELKQELENLISKHNLNQKIKLSGMVSNVSDYYKIIDLFVLPSFSESTNMGLLEAMFYKTVCLSSDCGGIPEIITDGENGYLFKTGDFDQMGKKIIYIYENFDKLDFIRANASELVKTKFNLISNIKIIENKILEIIDSGK